jgi:hypothetical protein
MCCVCRLCVCAYESAHDSPFPYLVEDLRGHSHGHAAHGYDGCCCEAGCCGSARRVHIVSCSSHSTIADGESQLGYCLDVIPPGRRFDHLFHPFRGLLHFGSTELRILQLLIQFVYILVGWGFRAVAPVQRVVIANEQGTADLTEASGD